MLLFAFENYKVLAIKRFPEQRVLVTRYGV
jgi:hypothetical protein